MKIDKTVRPEFAKYADLWICALCADEPRASIIREISALGQAGFTPKERRTLDLLGAVESAFAKRRMVAADILRPRKVR